MIAHTALLAPFSYQVAVEQWIESRKWNPETRYKALQKCGLANVLAVLEKTASTL